MPYLTPDAVPADTICRILLIPADRDCIAIVTGALQQLTFDYNFEAFGAASVADTVAAFTTMFDRFCFGEGKCRMVGEIVPFAGDTSPDPRWLPCDGASLLRADYPDLFAVIGTAFGATDGSHFSLPDLRGRVVLGAGDAPTLSAYNVGDAGGEEAHTLTTSESAAHSHTDSGHSHLESAATPTLIAIGAGVPAASAIPAAVATGAGFAALDSSGGGGAHNNLQPYLAITYLIVALP